MFEDAMLQKLCGLQLPPSYLLALIAFLAALVTGIVARSIFDLRHIVPIGNWTQTQRNLLQWLFVAGLALVVWGGLARPTYEGNGDFDLGPLGSMYLHDNTPAHTLGVWIGCLMAAAAAALWGIQMAHAAEPAGQLC